MKLCKECKQLKSTTNFYLFRNGLSNNCKVCTRKLASSRRKNRRKVEFSSEWWDKKFYTRKHGAKRRGIPFTITREEFKEIFSKYECSYCKTTNPPFQLDRIDNALGYFKENIKLSCPACNNFKHSVTIEQVELRIRKYSEKLRQLSKLKKMLISS